MAPLWCHVKAVEKRRPSFRLERFQAVCGDPRRLAITRSALLDALSMGFGRADVAAVVRSMKASRFYKSMTSFTDSRRWQDVFMCRGMERFSTSNSLMTR